MKKPDVEEIKVKGSQIVEKVRELIEEGNARRISIKKDNRVYLEIPLTWGVGGAVAALWLAPVMAAVGALAALVSDVTIVIEPKKTTDSNGDSTESRTNVVTPAQIEKETGRDPLDA